MKIMKNPTAAYLVVTLAVLGGLTCDYFGTTYPLDSKSITVVQSGKPVVKDVIDVPIEATILRLVSMLAYTLATSIFVSVFIMTKIEASRHAEQESSLNTLRDTINQDVFDALFKRLVPSEIFASIKKDIIVTSLVRRNAQLIYDFTETNNEVTLRNTLRYELDNVTDTIASDVIKAELLTETPEDRLLKVKCVIDDREELMYDSTLTTQSDKVTITSPAANRKEITISIGVPKSVSEK